MFTAKRRSRKLLAADVPLLLHIVWLLLKIEMLQRVLSLPRLVRLFDADPRGEAPGDEHLDRLAWLTRGVLSRIYGSEYCMKQSLILFYFMKRCNYPACIHFGVVKKAGRLKGHAWVELHGEPFAEGGDPGRLFTVMYTYPAVR